MSLAIVGVAYPNKDGGDRSDEIARCVPGEAVELVPEPDNDKDELAVAVYSCRGVQIGYVTAERCGRIGALIRSGRELQAIFQARTEFGAVARAAFDGEVPALPKVREIVADSEPVWYPDEVWLDE